MSVLRFVLDVATFVCLLVVIMLLVNERGPK
jgi:hypothetical protein